MQEKTEDFKSEENRNVPVACTMIAAMTITSVPSVSNGSPGGGSIQSLGRKQQGSTGDG